MGFGISHISTRPPAMWRLLTVLRPLSPRCRAISIGTDLDSNIVSTQHLSPHLYLYFPEHLATLSSRVHDNTHA